MEKYVFFCIFCVKIYDVPCSLCHNKLIDWSHLNWAISERNQTGGEEGAEGKTF